MLANPAISAGTVAPTWVRYGVNGRVMATSVPTPAVRLTRPQRDVLEWLLAYPGVEISWQPLERASWTAMWANEDARQHMVRTLDALRDFLGQDASGTAPRAIPVPGPTPRLTTGTFKALVRRGLVVKVRYRPQQGVWSSMGWWQISIDGIHAIVANR